MDNFTDKIHLSPNELIKFLKKSPTDFTREDIIKFIEEKGIRMLNFRYVAEDGKLKSLNFIISGKAHLESILSNGERVDGSSLFSFIEPGLSDLYVVPRYKTAFVNPFSEVPSLEILCAFYTAQGTPLESAPEFILKKAHLRFKEQTGFVFKALGELEYYVNSKSDPLYPLQEQGGYHQGQPFSKFGQLRMEALDLLARAGCKIKYGHSEVGNFTQNGEDFEQHEIEFLPVSVEDAADQLVIAKWILRTLSYRHGVEVSFAPKISIGKAGSGLHIHMLLEQDGKNQMVNNGHLSETAKKLIAGILDLSPALSAFGNTVPTSYLRLVPNQEAPTRICWGDRNRSALIRVPLGWRGGNQMALDANPSEPSKLVMGESRQTVEYRAPDGSADIYKLLAGLVIAAGHGLSMKNSIDLAKKLYVDVNIFEEGNAATLDDLACLPDSCWTSATALEKYSSFFQKDGIFPSSVINYVIKKLRSYKDDKLSERLYGKDDLIHQLVQKYIHVM